MYSCQVYIISAMYDILFGKKAVSSRYPARSSTVTSLYILACCPQLTEDTLVGVSLAEASQLWLLSLLRFPPEPCRELYQTPDQGGLILH